MLTEQDYRDAILIQDACNLSGIVFAWGRVMKKICAMDDFAGMGTDWKNHHPINVLYASKVASLTGSEQPLGFSHAYQACETEAANVRA